MDIMSASCDTALAACRGGRVAVSFREKHLWITVLTTVVVWAVYFRELIVRVMDGGMADPRFPFVMGVAFAGAVFVVSVIEVALTAIATLTTPKAERRMKDEREVHAALKASHVALMLLIVLVISLSVAAYFTALAAPTFGTHLDVTSGGVLVVMANIMVACIVVAELVRAGLTLALLRALR